jgi:drug/metabolite transporter (DMT)-like permease
MMDYMHLADIEISAMIKPFCVSWLGIIFLGEKFYPFYLKYGLFAIAGFLVVNKELIPGTVDGHNISLSTKVYENTNIWFLISYIAIASVGQITRRYYCRQCKYTMQGVCVEFVMFALYGIIFLIYRNTFSFKILFSPYALIVSLITILHHFCLIHGVQKAHSVTALEFVNFSKIIFTIIFSYLILGYRAPGYKIVGAIIIAVTLILFNRRLRKIAKNH